MIFLSATLYGDVTIRGGFLGVICNENRGCNEGDLHLP